jgi:hypothetical protein
MQGTTTHKPSSSVCGSGDASTTPPDDLDDIPLLVIQPERVRGAGRAYQAQTTSLPDQTDVSLLKNMEKTDPAGQEVKKSEEAAVKINGKAENIAEKTSVKKSYKKKVTETVKKSDNRVEEKSVKGKDTVASPKNLAESNDSLLNRPDKTEGVTVVKSNPAAKAEQLRASMSPPVRKGPPPAKESSTGDVNKKRPASAADCDVTKEKNTKGKKKLKATGSAVVENGTAEELAGQVGGQGTGKRKKDSQPSGRVQVETTGPPLASKRPASEEEERKLGKKVKTLPAPALAAQGENNTGKKTAATAVSTASSVSKKAAVSNSATQATVVKQEPAATDNGGGGGDQEGDRGPESGGPPVVRLPTYTHMIKQALAGKGISIYSIIMLLQYRQFG